MDGGDGDASVLNLLSFQELVQGDQSQVAVENLYQQILLLLRQASEKRS